MSATTDIQTRRKKGVVSVPIQAVTMRDVHRDSIGKEEKLVEFAFLERGGRAVMQEVKTGIQNDTYIEILEGVTVGDKVVTAPFNAISKDLEDGDLLEVVSKEELYK